VAEELSRGLKNHQVAHKLSFEAIGGQNGSSICASAQTSIVRVGTTQRLVSNFQDEDVTQEAGDFQNSATHLNNIFFAGLHRMRIRLRTLGPRHRISNSSALHTAHH
jgi:hypothetical protein